MRMKIWTVASDDDEGTRATVHTTEKAAYEQWLEWQFRSECESEEEADKNVAAAFIDREDYVGLWKWKGDREFGEPLNTFMIEEHEIEIPTV